MKAFLLAVVLVLLAGMGGNVNAAPTDGYVNCAAEGQLCAVATTGVIIYGAGSSYTAPVPLAPPGILCTNAIAGDPINGTVKTCWFRSDATAPAVPKSCVPKTSLTPLAAGTQLVTTRTTAGECADWWCPGAALPDGRTQWSVKKQCVLDKYRNKSLDPLSIAKAILTASDPAQAISDAITTGATPPVGPQETYDFAYLNWVSCQAITKPENMPANFSLTSNNCGAMPVAPAPTGSVWHTPATGTYKLYTAADGKLTGNITGRTATPNAVCDSSGPPAKSGTSTYYPLKGGPSTEFTLCVTP